MNDELWEKAKAQVAALQDEEVLACFGCCPMEPGQAREILTNEFYEQLLSGYNG